jgi:U3 small nucleolar RNA-associated protein 10
VLSAFQANTLDYIGHLSIALCDKPKRPILRAHMSFLLGSFRVEKEAEKIKDKIFHEIIFSFLMVSRPRKKSVNTVWEMIVQNASGFTCSHPWLAGCTDVWKARTINDTTEEEETVEYMTKTISALADRIAGMGDIVYSYCILLSDPTENIIVSNHFLDQVSNLLEHLNDKNTYGRIFALLVAKGLITKLSGEEQLKAAAKIVGAMTVTNVVGVLYEDVSCYS